MSEYEGEPAQHYDQGAETALLAECLQAKNCRIEARRHLLPGDLFVPAHEAVYDAMTELDRLGREVTLVTVQDQLTADHSGSRSGGGDSLSARHHAASSILMGLMGLGVGNRAAAGEYARIVHRWALRRRYADEGRRLTQRALSPHEDPERLGSEVVTRLQGLRDTGGGEVSALSLRELMHMEDDEPEWVIPGLFERGDRLMLTGSEGAGKSALSRQLVMMAAAGLHPFTESVIPPIRSYVLDVENKPTQVRRQSRPLLNWLREQPGASDPMDRVHVDAIYPRRIDLTSDRDLSWVHQTLDTWKPDIVVLGPIYRMSPRALQTDDEAHPFLAALDTLTERGCALIVEAHAGHSQEGQGKTQARALRPRGSSALLGWPEFGLGLRGLGRGLADLEPWRGHREQRAWPTGRLRQAPGHRWVEAHPEESGGTWEPPPWEEPPPAPPEPQGALL